MLTTARGIARATRVIAAQRLLPVTACSSVIRSFSSKPPAADTKDVATTEQEEAEALALQKIEERQVKLQERVQEMQDDVGTSMIWGRTDDDLPDFVLPDSPKELALLDRLDEQYRLRPDGQVRTVIIRQIERKVRQAPDNHEHVWKIYFQENSSVGVAGAQWINSLMGWVSNADPYQADPMLLFSNAREAVDFAKKRGWEYVVQKPLLREVRQDGAQYQDNFLPQAIALKVQMEGIGCSHWERPLSGASHYFRPLKYHGDGLVDQYGPNPKEPTMPHVTGDYKPR